MYYHINEQLFTLNLENKLNIYIKNLSSFFLFKLKI